MARLAVPLGLALLAGITWLLLRASPEAPPETRPRPGVEDRATQPAPLPALTPTDAPVDEVAPSLSEAKLVETTGPFGRSADLLAARLTEGGWRPVAGVAHTWEGLNAIRLSYRVEDGRVRGASAFFPPNAMSADLKVLSTWMVGSQDALPLHWEAYTVEDAEKPRTGSFVTAKGVTLHYRGILKTAGEPPYGPERLELSLDPFAAHP